MTQRCLQGFSLVVLTILFSFFFLPHTGLCAEYQLDGTRLKSFFWVAPFTCMLLSIALLPLLTPNYWHANFGKISVFWACAFLVPFAVEFGPDMALYEMLTAFFHEYVPFIILLLALFTVAGGIRLKGSLVGTPLLNTTLLAIGTAFASWMGTTGAAMLLIRPLIRANAFRVRKTHSIIFFIFLVANAGGCLTPLGDPPLFLGFLKGVSFFWTLKYLLKPMLFLSVILLILYFLLDSWYFAKEGKPKAPSSKDSKEKLGIEGGINGLFLVGIVGGVLMSGIWSPGISVPIYKDLSIELQDVSRDCLLLFITWLSLHFTSNDLRNRNEFNWGPIVEVGKLFFGIFFSMIPAIAILKSGSEGILAPIINMVSSPEGQPNNVMYFWLSGLLSSFLDNAPTYVVFFNTAGGDPLNLMTERAATLMAISAGAVFMGANTYIGNAPNFMVRAMAEDAGIKMPSFFGYMLWPICILFPCFLLMTVLFIR